METIKLNDSDPWITRCVQLQERVEKLEKALAKYIDSETLSAAEFEEKYYPFASPINIIADARAALSPKEPGGVK